MKYRGRVQRLRFQGLQMVPSFFSRKLANCANGRGHPGCGARQSVAWEIQLMPGLAGSFLRYVYENKSDVMVSTEFLAALTASESPEDPRAKRSEPGVYPHLKSVAQGRVASRGFVTNPLLNKEIEREEESARTAEAGSAESHVSGHPSPCRPSIRDLSLTAQPPGLPDSTVPSVC